MSEEPKSILDNVPVEDTAFPLKKNLAPVQRHRLEVSGHCVYCGAPIYAKFQIVEGEVPAVQYSCSCLHQNKGLQSRQT